MIKMPCARRSSCSSIFTASTRSPSANPTTLALLAPQRDDIGLVLQDMNFTQNTMTGEEGIALFERIRAADPDVPILLMTAWTSLETAVNLVKEGASDYIAKPWDDEKLARRRQVSCPRRRVSSSRKHVRLRGPRQMKVARPCTRDEV